MPRRCFSMMLVALALGGCHVVLGFDDHQLDPGAESGTAGGGPTASTTTAGGQPVASSSVSGVSSGDASGGGAGGGGTGGGGQGAAPPSFAIEVVASDQDVPSDLAFDASGLYWTNRSTDDSAGAVLHLGSDGVPVPLIEERFLLRRIALDGNGVYFLAAYQQGGSSHVGRTPKSGGGFSMPCGSGTGSTSFLGLALQGTVIAVSAQFDAGAVFRCDVAGGPKNVLATGQEIARAVALDGPTTYWTSTTLGAVMRHTSGTTTVFASGQSDPSDVTLDATHVYWSGGDGTIRRLAKDDAGGVPELLAEGARGPQGIAVDAEYVYWAELGDDSGERGVGAVAKAGGAPVIVAPGLGAFDVVTDGDREAYASFQIDGRVIRITRE